MSGITNDGSLEPKNVQSSTKNSDILDESLNASDIKHLYKLITQLYNATFNE